MTQLLTTSPEDAGRYAPDGPYALARLGLSLLIATLVGAGMWAVIVILPQAQLEFGVDRSAASLPYSLMMFGLAFGTIVLGRMADRTGIAVPLAIAGSCLGLGFVLAGYAPNPFSAGPCSIRARGSACVACEFRYCARSMPPHPRFLRPRPFPPCPPPPLITALFGRFIGTTSASDSSSVP